jgi:hypothetical protein
MEYLVWKKGQIRKMIKDDIWLLFYLLVFYAFIREIHNWAFSQHESLKRDRIFTLNLHTNLHTFLK